VSTPLLCLITVLIWGSTWLAIKFQLGTVAIEASIAYRFFLASFILLAWCLFKRKNLRYSLKDHALIFFQAFCIFSLNYFLHYLASQHLISGLNAVVSTSVIFFNIFNSALFFKQKIRLQTFFGAIVGVFGLYLIFSPELYKVNFDSNVYMGICLGLSGSFLASCGSVLSIKNSRRGVEVTQANAFGMFYGACIILLLALITQKPLTLDWSALYLGSLLYLALFGSIFAFGAYLTLITRIGADNGSYVLIFTPVVALFISQLFEGFHWQLSSALGLSLMIVGNVLILHSRKKSLQASAFSLKPSKI
jgi:drug/metabolite transporter (DMT)-like permease